MTFNDPSQPKCWSKTVTTGSTYGAGNGISFANVATFLQISTNQTISVKLNGDSNAVFTLASGVQTFDSGDLYLTSIDFANSSGSTATIQVIAGVRLG